MSTEVGFPNPLTPVDCDLRSYDWFPLYFKRLKRSAFWARASGDVAKASVDLWCEAYEQVPAGSMPDDDVALATACGFGRREIDEWLKLKGEVMEAWTLCSDGRWYHRTLCEIIMETWDRKADQREKERLKKAAQRAKSRGDNADVPGDKKDRSPPSPLVPPITGQDRTGQDITDSTADAVVDVETPTLHLVALPSRSDGEVLVEAWNAMVDRVNPLQPKNLRLGRIVKFDGKVKTYAEARLKEYGLASMLELMDRVEVNRFLRGGDNGPGRTWRAGFEFMVTASKTMKMMNGEWSPDMEAGQELHDGTGTGVDRRSIEHSERIRRNHDASLAGLE